MQGGVTDKIITDTQHSDIVYDTGQIIMGATWNRYGEPAQQSDDDWAVALAHELGHYLLYLDDVYLDLDDKGLLIPVRSCTGSAMGDVYSIENHRFLSTEEWQAK